MPLLRRRERALAPARGWIAADALAEMTTEADRAAPKETGGMLLGYTTDEGGIVDSVIELVIGPGPDAVHESARFEPDGPWQRARLGEIYRDSPSATYLGDWHTHPGGGPAASELDRKTAAAIARRRRARAPYPLMAILHGEPAAWELAVYCFAAGQLRLIPIRPLSARP